MSDWSLGSEKAPVKDQESPTWGDYGRVAGSSLQGLDAQASAAARYVHEKIGADDLAALDKTQEQISNIGKEQTLGGLSDEAHKRLEASITSGDFWSHPFSAGALKTTGMSAQLLASALPGGVVGGAVRATIAAGAAGGAVNAAQFVDSIYSKTDALSDKDLQSQSELYAGLRTMFDEGPARQQYNATIMGAKPALNFAVGAIANAIGPAGMLARGGVGRVLGAGEKGMAKRIGLGAAEGGGGGAAQGGVENYTEQNASIEGGLVKDFDREALVNAMLEPAVIGGAIGAGAGVLPHGKPPKTKEVTPKVTEEAPTDTHAQQSTGRTGYASPPDVNAAPPNPQNAPTGSERVYDKTPTPAVGPKGEAIKAKSKKTKTPTVDTPIEIPPDQAAALKERAPAVEAVSDRQVANDLAEQHAPAPPPEPVQQPVQQQVPPDVAAASQRVAERIAAAAVQTEDGAVFTGINHGDAAAKAEAAGHSMDLLSRTDGFVTSTGRYVDRIQAKRIADAEGQVKPSEDSIRERSVAEKERLMAHEVFDEAGNPLRPAPPDVAAASKAVARRAQERGLERAEFTEPAASTATLDKTPQAQTKPRILEDKSEEAKATIKAQREQEAKNLANALEPKAAKEEIKPGERLSHDTAAEKEKIEADRAHAKELFAKHAPTPAEADFMSEDRTKAKASRKAILDRVSAIIHEAVERGIDLKQRIHTSQSDEMAWLTEANSLLGKTKTKLGPIQKHYVQFKTRDNDYRSGNAETARAERKSEGAAAANRYGGDAETAKVGEGVKLERSEDKAASKVRQIKLTAEERAKYEKPAVTLKVAAIKEKVQSKAEGKVNTNPSEAQKEAGNYAKTHINVDGLNLSIENPRGSTRSGIGPDGKRWEVVMPDHYGYIKRTEGADGDHVDITYSGKGEHVFVIDQIDPSTGKFDEHKVMYGYKDGPAAMEAYEKSFSDGRGFDRIGNITPMSKEAFKTWLKEGNTKKEAAPQHELPIPTDAVALKGERQPIVPTPLANSHYRPLHISTAREVIPNLKLPKGEISQAIGVVVSKRLEQLVGDTAIHVVSERDMTKFTEANGGNPQTPYAGLYSPRTGVVYVNEKFFNGDQGLRTHVVLHELLHAAVYRAIEKNPGAAENVKYLMQEVRDHLDAGFTSEWEVAVAQYGLTNPHEFISEALSNPEFQKLLAKIDMTDRLADYLKGTGVITKHSRWSTAWDGLVISIRRWLGLPSGAHTLLEGALAQGDWLMSHRGSAEINKPADWKPGSRPLELPPRVREAARDRATDIGGSLRRTADKWLSSFRQLSYRAAAGGEQFHANARSLVDAVSRMHQEATKILGEKGGEKVVRDIAEFERAHGTEALNQVAKVGFEASNVNVNLGKSADNTHLGKDVANNVQAKERLPGLQKDFDALHPEGQALLQSIGKYFRDMQNELSLQHITNILDHAGVNEPGLAQRIHQDGLTDADRQKFATDSPVRALNRVREFKRLQGLYLPFRRYGDFVVNGRHELVVPKSATRLDDGRVVFADPANNGGDKPARDAALNWARTHDLTHTDTNKIFVDKQDHSKILPADDPNSVPAYAIRLQDQHTEFHTSESAAQRRAAELSEDGLKDVSVELRRELAAKNPGMMGGDMKMLLNALEKQTRFQNAPASIKNAMRQALTEAAVSAQGSTKIQSRFLQRRNVSGYSQDLGKVTAEYAKTSARYLAKLRYQPKVDEAFAAMDKTISDLKHQNNGQALRRSELRQAFDQAIHSEPAQEKPGALASVASRLMQWSRLDKLAGPSFHIINVQQPATVALPVIGGRHGFTAAARTMSSIYRVLGAGGAIASGIKDTFKARTQDFGFTDYIKHFKDSINSSPSLGGDKAKRYNEVLDYVRDRGLLNDSSIFEVGKHSDPTSNVAGRFLDRADLMANQLGKSIEDINRAVTALTAYELEYKRTGNHEGAMHYALETTDKTMFDYSGWNSAGVFKKAPLVLQFKKYAQHTYYLLGSTFRGALAGDREAAKQFAGLMVTHAVIAGAMGLPLEPFKVALMAANMFGIVPYTWQDFEQLIREKTAATLGKKGGEIFSHGLTRAIGIEAGGRQGLESLMTWGAPKSNKPNDLKAWLFDTAAGAPIGLLLDQVKMSQALMKGDFAQAAELAVPIKAASDAIKAARGVTPTTNDRGQETQRAMTPYEMGARAIGFTPAAIAEQGERRAQAGRMSAQQRQERQDFENNWAKAKPYDRMLLWGRIEQWNKGRPRESQLTRSQLDSFVRSQGKSNAADVGGIRNSKQNRDVLERVSVYNN